MKIKLVSVKQGISAIGFRKIIAIVRQTYPDADVYFIPLSAGLLISSKTDSLIEDDIEIIFDELKDADIVLFSSVTLAAEYIEKICIKLKAYNPNIYIAWGGAHATLLPEEAILYTDCVCVGEGEKVILDIIKDRPKGIISGPLLTSEELDKSPYAYNDYDCLVYRDRKFKPLDERDYAKYHGLLYRNIWSRGCPFSCTYCSNSALKKISKDYAKLRHPSVDYIIGETKEALKKYSFTTTVNFDDDNLIALPLPLIEEFCQKYKEQIGIPFAVTGVHPSFVTREKVECLMKAGMKRVRMGIQSGSEETLKFYNRPAGVNKIIESSNILAELAKKYHTVPPLYDIITDNPLESIEEQFKTLKLVNNLKRPFRLTVFSLRAMRKTKLEDILGRDTKEESSYLDTQPTLMNILLCLLPIIKIPNVLLDKLQDKIDRRYPILAKLAKRILLAHIMIGYITSFDFSKIAGKFILLFKRRKQLR